MPLGRETENYKSKFNESDFSAQMLLLEVKWMSYLLTMKNKKLTSSRISHSYITMS